MASSETSSGTFTLLYFAAAQSYTKSSSEKLPAPMNFSELPTLLEEHYPGIKAKILDSCAFTINLEYINIDETLVIKQGDEVAIIPPVSSG
jgi:molybdopterin converting factor small subunit